MITAEYRIRIEAFGPKGEVIAAMEQRIEQDTLKKARPRMLISLIENLVRTFLRGHKEAEKRATKYANAGKVPKRKTRRLGLTSLLDDREASHA